MLPSVLCRILSAPKPDIRSSGSPSNAQDNWLIGAAAPFGQWNFKLSYAESKGGGTIPGSRAAQFAIGADYNLSKRTALYGTYSAIDNEATSDFKVLGASSTLSRGNNSQGVQLGVRHTF